MSTISKYRHVMYLSPASQRKEDLKTGDVIELTSIELSNVLEHDSMKKLIKQFDKDKPNRPKLWAVLNKACDMAHNSKQKFTTNLFLCPLHGLRDQIKNGQLKTIRYVETAKSPIARFKSILERDITSKVKAEVVKEEEETTADYGKRLQGEVSKSILPITGFIDQIGEEDNPTNFEVALKASTASDENVNAYVDALFKIQAWQSYCKEYKRIQNSSSFIIFKEGSTDKISKLCRNQLESSGMFFYEPHLKIYKKGYDLSYVIEFEDMLTLKVKKNLQDSGKLVELLKNKRVLSLKPMFSSRLQNMIGSYFAKIGTEDILSQNVLNLYKKYFKNNMFFSVSEYKDSL